MSTEGSAPSPRPGMGAIPFDGGTLFRVWAPNAEAVAVAGTFNEWQLAPLARDGNGEGGGGTWSAEIAGAHPGDEYQFVLRIARGGNADEVWRLDPRARAVTNSTGNAIIVDHAAFDWSEDDFRLPTWDDLVIYELHLGTFTGDQDRVGTFDTARRRLAYLRDLGVSAVQVMPPFEFAGDISWGYNPALPFAIESAYGGPDAFKRFVRDAHAHGIAVIVDVVFNHLGPSDLDLWQFDGWSEHDGGGIYFYNDDRAPTPWGATRPDYGRGEVRTYLRDAAMTWLEDYRCDGLRFDSTVRIRTVDGNPGNPATALPDGWSLMAWINDEIAARKPWKITIAEDLQNEPAIVRATADGGAGFDAQWDAGFVRPIRAALTAYSDTDRDMAAVAAAVLGEGRGVPLSRVIYTESHDDVANGSTRLPEAVAPGDADSWWGKKRATLGAALVLASPGIPMLFQGQEMLEDGWFTDTEPLDWEKASANRGILRLHRDLVSLRRDMAGVTRGLRGSNSRILRADNDAKLLVLHRWMDGGIHDDTIVVASFADRAYDDVRIGFPAGGRWAVRFNSDAATYDHAFGSHEVFDLDANGEPADGCDQSGIVSVGPYSVVILSRES